MFTGTCMHCYVGAALPCAEIMFQSRTENASLETNGQKTGTNRSHNQLNYIH